MMNCFLPTRKRNVQNFIHLNLAIALFLGYLTFAVGTELAVKNEVSNFTTSKHLILSFRIYFQILMLNNV